MKLKDLFTLKLFSWAYCDNCGWKKHKVFDWVVYIDGTRDRFCYKRAKKLFQIREGERW